MSEQHLNTCNSRTLADIRWPGPVRLESRDFAAESHESSSYQTRSGHGPCAFLPWLQERTTGHLHSSYLPWRRTLLHVLGVRAIGIFHSTATLSSEGSYGLDGACASCTVSIFSCPTPALGLGGLFFCWISHLTLTIYMYMYMYMYILNSHGYDKVSVGEPHA